MAKFTQKGLQSRQRAYSDEATGSVATPLKGLEIQAPGLTPQAAPVDSFVRTGRPNAPGAVQLGELARLPEPAEITNLENLSRSLGSLNANLQNAVNSYLGYQKDVNEELKLEAAAIVEQTAKTGRNPEETLASIGKEMINIASNPENDIKERTGAEKIINQLKGDGRLKRHITSEIKKQQVIRNASNLSNLASGAMIGDQPLESFSSSSDEYIQWQRDNIYGDLTLSGKEHSESKNFLVNSIAQDKARQDKAYANYTINQYGIVRTQTIDNIGKDLAENGEAAVERSIDALQGLLDDPRIKLPGLTEKEKEQLELGLPTSLFRYFATNNQSYNTDILEKVINGLMIGPEKDRYTAVISEDDSLTWTRNENLLWVNSKGGQPWLDTFIDTVKAQIFDADKKAENAEIFNSSRASLKKFGEEDSDGNSVLSLLNKGEYKDAAAKVDQIKDDILQAGIDNGEDIAVTFSKIDYVDKAFDKLAKIDDFEIESDKAEINKLIVKASTQPKVAQQMISKLNILEDKYIGRADVLKWVGDMKLKVAGYAEKYNKQFYTHLKQNHLNKYRRDWDSYAKSPLSYDGTDTEHELNMFTKAEILAEEIADEIIQKGTAEGLSAAEIKKNISDAITMENIGLIYEAEQAWEPSKGAIITGTSEDAFDQLEDLANLKSSAPRERGILQSHIDGRKPMFELDLLEKIADDAWNGTINSKLKKVLEKTDRPLGTFLILEFKKYGLDIDEATKEKLEQLNSL